MFEKFSFRNAKKAQPAEIDRSSTLCLSDVDFKYGADSRKFKNFSYRFDIRFPSKSDLVVPALLNGIKNATDLLDKIYLAENGFSRNYKGDVSRDEKMMEIAYTNANSFSVVDSVTLNFKTHFENDLPKRAYFLVYLSERGQDQETLLSAHDALIAIPQLELAKEAVSGIIQIERIRSGAGPKLENFLLG